MKPLDPVWLQLAVIGALAGIAAGAFVTGDRDLAKTIGVGFLGALALHPRFPNAQP